VDGVPMTNNVTNRLNIFKDNSIIGILLLAGVIIYITIYWGKWVHYLKPSINSRVFFSTNQFFEPGFDLYETESVAVFTTLGGLDSCYTMDSLQVNLSIAGRADDPIKTESVHIYNEGKTQATLKGTRICPGNKISIAQVFKLEGIPSSHFRVTYIFTDDKQNPLQRTIDLVVAKKFQIGSTNGSKFVMVLYPILWIAFGVVLLAKITRLIKK
jgi:hypothetical protein